MERGAPDPGQTLPGGYHHHTSELIYIHLSLPPIIGIPGVQSQDQIIKFLASFTPPQLLLTHHLVTSGRADWDLLQRPPPPGPRPPEGGPHPQPGLHQGDQSHLVSLSSALTPAGGHLHPLRLQGAEPGALRGLRPSEHRAALQPGRFRWVHTVL